MRDILAGAAVYGLGGLLMFPVYEASGAFGGGHWAGVVALTAVGATLAWLAGGLTRRPDRRAATRGVAAVVAGAVPSGLLAAGYVLLQGADLDWLELVLWVIYSGEAAAVLPASAVAAFSASRPPWRWQQRPQTAATATLDTAGER